MRRREYSIGCKWEADEEAKTETTHNQVTQDEIAYEARVSPSDPAAMALLDAMEGIGSIWTESLPYFCQVTETIVDLANCYAQTSWDLPQHPLEARASAPSATVKGTNQVTKPVCNAYTCRIGLLQYYA